MRALSLKQPWLYAITDLGKRVENRTWRPPDSILGRRIVLHASKTWDKDGEAFIENMLGSRLIGAFEQGSIVATAVVVGWVAFDYEAEGEVIYSDAALQYHIEDRWFFGPWGWILDDVRKLRRPVQCRGMLGLWRLPEDILKRIQEDRQSE